MASGPFDGIFSGANDTRTDGGRGVGLFRNNHTFKRKSKGQITLSSPRSRPGPCSGGQGPLSAPAGPRPAPRAPLRPGPAPPAGQWQRALPRPLPPLAGAAASAQGRDWRRRAGGERRQQQNPGARRCPRECPSARPLPPQRSFPLPHPARAAGPDPTRPARLGPAPRTLRPSVPAIPGGRSPARPEWSRAVAGPV